MLLGDKRVPQADDLIVCKRNVWRINYGKGETTTFNRSRAVLQALRRCQTWANTDIDLSEILT